MPDVVERDRRQAEFTRALWDYLGRAVSDARIENGQARMAEVADVLARIESRTGVDRYTVAAIWGLESAYGAVRGDVPVIPAMATLAAEGRRNEFFETQLIAALRILQDGDTTLDQLKGSWAGAMGHTQFMPSSFLDLAVDHDGDGRRDIWGEDPADALASTAAYLANAGLVTGQPWGVEVRLPEDFDYLQADRTIRRSPAAWAEMGVLDMEGAPVDETAAASILLPMGHRGPAFMIFDNFAAIERYNTADAYVIAVGHLSDRLRGMGPIRAEWPQDRALTFDERVALQERLTAAGFSTRGVDGRIGPLTIDAIRGWQAANGQVPDGYASPDLLEALP